MKVVSIYRIPADAAQSPPTSEMMANMGALINEMMTAGVLIDTGGVIPNGITARVRANANGTFSTTDGPFTETKEIVGGFAVFEVASKEELLKWTERFLALTKTGECELIEVTGPPG